MFHKSIAETVTNSMRVWQGNMTDIDAKIAKLMGWEGRIEVCQTKLQPLWRTAFKIAPGDGLGSYSRFYDKKGNKIFCGEPHGVHFPPSFSTSIAAAFEVVEKMREKYDVTMECFSKPDELPNCFRVTIDGRLNREGNATTLPEAICLAALKVK